jgi:hypothetical protein
MKLKELKTHRACMEILQLYGKELINSPKVQRQKEFIQHGKVTVYEHCINVAYMSILLIKLLKINFDKKSVVRGALLHDYFLYDWHIPSSINKLHGFTHARTALKNATRDFELNDVEKDIILKHMFPLNPALPRFKESLLVCIADKICAVYETFSIPIIRTSKVGGRSYVNS